MALSVNGGVGSKGGGSNPNLLDNGWFTVNQRGVTSYPNTSATGYCLDRWRRHAGVEVGVETDGISANLVSGGANGLSQVFESNLKIGNTVTVSILMQNGTMYKGSGVLGDNGATGVIDNDYIKVNVRLNTFYIDFKTVDNILHIRAIKLEYGSVSTLALDSAPNYATELLKCQRYYYKMPSSLIGSALARNNTSANVFIMLPTTMRIIPTITIHGTINLSDGVNANPITSFGTIGNGYNTVSCLANSTGLTQYRSYVLAIPSGDTNYLDISADL